MGVNNKKNYVYDLETYPNLFCGVFNCKGKESVFEISARKNDFARMIRFYKPENIGFAIGFNNCKFDAQVMQYLVKNEKYFRVIQGSELVKKIYEFAQSVIQKSRDKEFLPFAEWNITVPQIDLYAINHYNNKARITSLKWIEFSINHEKVQDLPYKFDRPLHSSTFDEVIEYCKNDVNATRHFAEEMKDLIKLRISQDKQYPDLRLRNKPDSSVGETLFLHFMSESMGIDKKRLKEMRTPRSSLYIDELILPYINFKTPEFQSILDWYKDSRSGGLEKSLWYKGLEYVFAEGGLHASWNNKIFEADDEYDIIDIDVKSFYPNMAIVNGFRPEHLGEAFLSVYKNIYNERTKYGKGTIENHSYKIILNGAYGKFGDEHSFLYDKKVMLQICINGQLMIAMLCERLSFLDSVTVIQANTDGVTIRVKKSQRKEVEDICKRWEKLTQLELEYANYKKMVINNVNNYMAQDTKGKIKDKGAAYIVNPEHHKNKSQRIVQIALRRYFFEGIPIRDTVENHLTTKEKGMEWNEEKQKYEVEFKGIYDFCIGKKVQWNQTFVLIKGMEEKDIGQKVIRYYMTREKATMMKKYDDGRIEAVNKGYNARLFQNYEKKKDYGINYEYYINECYKITTPFDKGNPKIGKQLSLFE